MTATPSDASLSKWRWIAAGIAVLVLLAAWHLVPLQEWLKALDERIEGMGFFGGVLYAAVYVAASLVFVPGSILSLVAGYVFGIAGGMAVVWAGTTAAAAAGFLVARHLARRPVERLARLHPRFGAVDAAVGKNGWKVVALLRLAAIVPFSLSNYLFGLSSVDFVPYIVTTAVAMLPGTFFYVYLGATGRSLGEKGDLGPWEWALLGIGLVATAVMTVVLARVANKHLKSSGTPEADHGSLPEAPRIGRRKP